MEMPLQPNLTGVLALTALADLLLYRLAAHVFLPAQSTSCLARVLWDTGAFAANLGGVLGLVLIVTALVRALRGETLFPRSMRITVSAVALFFVVLAGLGVSSADGNGRFLAHLQISRAFLALFLVVGLLRAPGPGRAKLGVSLLAFPGVLQAAALFLDNRPWAPGLAGQLVRAADLLALVGAALSVALLLPRPCRGWRLALAALAGSLALGASSWAVVRHFGAVQLIALYGFRLDLPALTSPAGWLYAGLLVAAVTGLSAAAAGCLVGPGSSRLLAYGLILVGVAGHQPVASNMALFALCGLFAVALGSLFSGGESARQAVSLPTPAAAPDPR